MLLRVEGRATRSRRITIIVVAGEITDISLKEIIAYMMPGSDQVMAQLIEKRNPYAVISNAKTSDADVGTGATLFLNRCSSCQGPDGNGSQVAPALVGREFKHGDSDWAVYRTIRDGIANTAMAATPDLNETQRWQVIAFVRALGARNGPAAAKTDRPTIDAVTPFASIADWLTYSGSYNGTRHSSLRAITSANVNHLTLKWLHQFEGQPPLEVTPLVRNGTMFVSVPPCTVQALDAATDGTLWTWQCTPANKLGGEFGTINRGVALLDDKIFFAAPDARLFAVNASTGKQVWQATVEQDAKIYYITGAPLAFRDLVVTATSTRQIGRGVIRREYRQGPLALSHSARSGRARPRNLGGRLMACRRWPRLVDRIVRSRARPALLGHRQSEARLRRRRPRRRQSLHELRRGATRRHRRARLAFSVRAT